MHEFSLLRDLLVLVAVAIPVVAVAQYFKIPTVVGFLLTGIAVGPHALGLIPSETEVAGLADLGVALLLFAIGLEMSLSRLIKIGKLVFQAGMLQVTLTIAVVAGAVVLAGRAVPNALLLGALVALSSTAIVLKAYADRSELDTPHGRMALAILLFQDLAVVVLIVLVPLLAREPGQNILMALARIGMSIGVLIVLVGAGRWLVPIVLERIIGFKNRELFTLSIGFFGLAAAYVASQLGLSLEIGAFLAGLVIAESEYGAQALSDVLPFRDLFTGIFFMSVGMLLNISFVAENLPLVFASTVAVTLIKITVTTFVVVMTRRSLEVSLLAALGLAQVGEFSFVLANAATPYGILDAQTYQLFLGTSIISMLAAPFLIAYSRPLASTVARWTGRIPGEAMPYEKKQFTDLADHAIIVGWGIAGRHLARVLKAAGFPYVVLEQNGQVVRAGRRSGESIYFGDGTRHDVLTRVGIERARVIVFSIASPSDERRGVAAAKQLNPSIHIIVRTRYIAAIDELRKLGASDVVVEEFEAALELFAKVLERYDIPAETMHEEVEAVRGAHYGLLRGEAQPDIRVDPLKHLAMHDALEIVEVDEGAEAIGENAVTLKLRSRTGAVVVAALRGGKAYHAPDPGFRFEPLDTVVLVGDRPALEKGAAIFRFVIEEQE